jgi:hypothetical protein
LCFEKELAEGQLYRTQEKLQMTRGESDGKTCSQWPSTLLSEVDQKESPTTSGASTRREEPSVLKLGSRLVVGVPQVASSGHIGGPGRPDAQNDASEAHSGHIWSQAAQMLKMRSLRPILPISGPTCQICHKHVVKLHLLHETC